MTVRESANNSPKVAQKAEMPKGSLMMFGANDRSSLLRSSIKNEELDFQVQKELSEIPVEQSVKNVTL